MNGSALKTRLQSDSRAWTLGRTALICLSGFAGYLEQGPSREFASPFHLLAVALLGIGFTFVYALSQSMARPGLPWREPSWSTSPFRLGKPLQFPWFAAHFFMAGALGMLLALLVRGAGDWKIISIVVAFGFGLRLGLILVRKVFRKRLVENQPASPE